MSARLRYYRHTPFFMLLMRSVDLFAEFFDTIFYGSDEQALRWARMIFQRWMHNFRARFFRRSMERVEGGVVETTAGQLKLVNLLIARLERSMGRRSRPQVVGNAHIVGAQSSAPRNVELFSSVTGALSREPLSPQERAALASGRRAPTPAFPRQAALAFLRRKREQLESQRATLDLEALRQRRLSPPAVALREDVVALSPARSCWYARRPLPVEPSFRRFRVWGAALAVERPPPPPPWRD